MVKESKKRNSKKGNWHKWYNPKYKGMFSIDKTPAIKGFFAEGAKNVLRCIWACNRGGKSTAIAYEATCHATGMYPDWWEGNRQEKNKGNNTVIWILSKSWKSSGETIQEKLFYEKKGAAFGTGMIPLEKIIRFKKATGTKALDCISEVEIRKEDGTVSTIVFKPTSSALSEFFGQTVDIVFIDEECGIEYFYESMARTTSVLDPLLVVGFTPLEGYTEFVQYLQKHLEHIFRISWAECPHLNKEQIDGFRKKYPKHQLKAREFGYPILEGGAIYPFDRDDIVVSAKTFELKPYYQVAYGLDVGYRCTAGIWVARDPHTDVMYIYDEMYRKEVVPIDYVDDIKSRGMNYKGSVDTAAGQRSQTDGRTVLSILEDNGLHLVGANKKVGAGIMTVYNLLKNDKLKIVDNCFNLLNEISAYQYDKKGSSSPANGQQDHACDAMRYVIFNFDSVCQELYRVDNPLETNDDYEEVETFTSLL